MHPPIVLWQPHGEMGRELVSELIGEGDLPLVVLQPDDQVRQSMATRSASALSLVSDLDQPPSLPDIVRALEDMLERWGLPSGVVLTPRAGRSAPFHELTLTDWRTLVEGAFLGVVYLLRAVIPLTLATPGARVVTLLPADPPVGRHDRAGATANSALRAALHATITELSREPGAADTLWFTLREGWPLTPEVAARPPASARGDSTAGLARLCHWLVREGPTDLSGADLCLPPTSVDG